MTSAIREEIIATIDEGGGKAEGTEALALKVNAPKPWVVKLARGLQALGVIRIIQSRGGRGNKTVYKRNRNSPGQPRKVR
jgi:hypothetical protein